MSGRKQEEYILPVYLFRNVKVKGYSSIVLSDGCSRNAGVFCGPETKTRIWILAQSFGSGSAQPLSPPLSNSWCGKHQECCLFHPILPSVWSDDPKK